MNDEDVAYILLPNHQKVSHVDDTDLKPNSYNIL